LLVSGKLTATLVGRGAHRYTSSLSQSVSRYCCFTLRQNARESRAPLQVTVTVKQLLAQSIFNRQSPCSFFVAGPAHGANCYTRCQVLSHFRT
jgi:hypothetical protein